MNPYVTKHFAHGLQRAYAAPSEPHVGIQAMLEACQRIEARKAKAEWNKGKFRDADYTNSFAG